MNDEQVKPSRALGMRFSLETLFGFMTLWAIDAALLASGSTAGAFIGGLLAASLVYVPIVWGLNNSPLKPRLRGLLVAISGGLVASATIVLLARIMA